MSEKNSPLRSYMKSRSLWNASALSSALLPFEGPLLLLFPPLYSYQRTAISNQQEG